MAKLTKTNAKELRNGKTTGDEYVDAGANYTDPDQNHDNSVAEAVQTATTSEKPKKLADRMDDVPTLSLPALRLLDRAVATTIKNRGQNLDDEAAKLRLSSQSDLLQATNGNIGVACIAIMESPTTDDLNGTDRRGNRVFSLLFSIMKSVMFNANGAFRRWLDPRFGTQPVADYRDIKESPWGLQPETEDEDFEATLEDAVSEIASLFGALAQACGYQLVPDGDAGTAGAKNGEFPLLYDQRADGSFEPVTSFQRALDMIEVKRQASLKRRAIAERAAYEASTKRALQLIAALQVKPTINA